MQGDKARGVQVVHKGFGNVSSGCLVLLLP